MPLFERLGEEAAPKIPVHAFQAVASEWARGALTGQQAQAAIEFVSGAPLQPDEVADAQALVNSITSLGQLAQRVSRSIEIDQVMLLLDHGVYTAAQARARLLG